MTDKVFQKQLDSFGIESVKATEGDVERYEREEAKKATLLLVKGIMETMAGRQYFFGKLDMCRVFTTPFVSGSPDATAYFCGVQSVGHNLLDDIMQASPENYWLMLQEADARKASKA